VPSGENIVWLAIDQLENEKFQAAVKEIDETKSDRAAAIVAATFVEDHLTRVLRHNFEQDDKLLEELFRPGGPLSDFGVKIDLGYLMGFYSKIAWKELDTIKKVRNDFAHKMEVRDFTHDRARELTNNLTMWEIQQIKLSASEGIGAKKNLMVTIGQNQEVGEKETLMFPTPMTSTSHRERFVSACKFYIAIMSLTINVPPLKRQQPYV
jgi:DNA-binding MltR family transcriptional regulator